jgi:hypothetical protein
VSLFTFQKIREYQAFVERCAIRSGAFPMSVSDILLHSKFTMAPDSFKKSIPIRHAASVGREHTKNWWLNFRLPNTKETVRRPLTSRVSPVTPYGRESENFSSLFDMPGCNIEMLEPVSTIKSLATPSIRTEIEGVPGSNVTETVGLVTAFTDASRREELSSLRLSAVFPNYSIPSSNPA